MNAASQNLYNADVVHTELARAFWNGVKARLGDEFAEQVLEAELLG